jgi:dolichol kinase
MAFADIRSEIPRSFFHILGGLALAFFGYFLPSPVNVYALVVIFGGAVLVEGVRLLIPAANRFARMILGPFMRPAEVNGLTGAVPFTGGVLLAFLLFSRSVALASMVPLVFGDRAGFLVGKAVGKRRIGGKTLEGSAGCFVTSLAAYGVLSALWPLVFDYTWPTFVGASIVGTLAEALPRPFDDNLTIPIAVGVFLSIVA